jgi:hypothetical protein
MTSLETLEGLWQARPGGLAFAVFAEGLHKAGRGEEAAEILAEGVRRWPRYLGGRLVQGRLAMEKGDIESARAVFQTAVDLDGSCRTALAGLAEASVRGQYFRQALDAWSRLAALDPDDSRAREEMRAAAERLDAPSGFDAVAMVREVEDDRSREALSEGTTSHVSGLTQTVPAFRFDLGDITAPSAFAAPHLDAPTIPELPGFQIPSTPAASSQTLLGRSGESSFATLEMPSFPSQTIPPPPLEIPRTSLTPPPVVSQAPALPRFPTTEDHVEAEATQFFAVQPPVSPATPAGKSPVTGDDIEDRLDEVFGSSSPVPPTVPSITALDAKSDSADGRVSGRDVEDRLGEIFGESSHADSVPAPAPAPTPAVFQPEPPTVASMPVVQGDAVVSGDDIEGRLDDLFGESVIDLTSPVSEGRGTGEDTSAMPKEEIFPSNLHGIGSDTAIARDSTIEARFAVPPRGAESTAEMNTRDLNLGASRFLDQAIKGSEIDPTGSTIDLPAIDAVHSSDTGRNTRLTSEDVDSRLDELFASSEFLAEPPQTSGRTGFVPRGSVPQAAGAVTGDDIEGRLDDLFGGDSDFPVSLPTVTFAEEYLRQGHRDKAASIYRQLLEKDPGNPDLSRRLSEIEGRS